MDIASWITHHSTLLGVPDTYISSPLLIAAAYCAQHSTVSYEDLHVEPVILYGLVVGRSGTNKSASLKIIMDLIDSIENKSGNIPHTFDSGSLEGLMKSMIENDGCMLGVHDEFAAFNDALDKGTAGSSEKARYLSLYSGTNWSKKTKTNGNTDMIDPRFNLIAYTQPYYATQFAQNNYYDGFFQRFLLSVPEEVFITIDEKKKCKSNQAKIIDMQKVFNIIYNRCHKKQVHLQLDEEAKKLYDLFHDEIVNFRKTDRFEESRLSVKSKSLGMVLRVAAVINLMNSALFEMKNIDYIDENKISKAAFEMATKIVSSSVSTAFALLPKEAHQKTSKKSSFTSRPPVPEPENITIEYLIPYHRQVKRILTNESIPLSLITRDKIYPVVNNESGTNVASKFVSGLENLGFGKFSPNSKSFKRYSPEDENCPDRENLRKKYKTLNINI